MPPPTSAAPVGPAAAQPQPLVPRTDGPEPLPQPVGPGSTGPVFNQSGEKGVQAYNYNLYLHGDYVARNEVPPTDPELRAAADDRFVPPRNAEQWKAAHEAAAESGVVVLNAPAGTGRRTQALRLLRDLGVRRLEELVPEWSKVSTGPLPKDGGCGFVLDLSSPSGAFEDRFADRLAAHGRELRAMDSCLVVLTTPDDWDGKLADGTAGFTVWPESPDARPLVRAELRARGASDRVNWLDEAALKAVWSGNPPVGEVRRLADLVAKAANRDELAEKVGEFTNWPTVVDGLLQKGEAAGPDAVLAIRATVWAGALLDGARRSSVLRAGDMLQERLGRERSPIQVLSDATGASRLRAAGLESDGERVHHATRNPGLAMAILRNLCTEFPNQQDEIRGWAVAVVSDRNIPEADARIAARTLRNLAVERRDRAVLDALAEAPPSRRPLTVETFTEAAGDPEIGRYLQARLLQWVSNSRTDENKVDMAIELCGGAWGQRHPLLALTRLNKAAGRKERELGTEQVRRAFRNLVTARPEEVRTALRQWLKDPKVWSDPKLERQVLASFLAVISSDEGADLVLAEARDPAARALVVKAWQGLLTLEDGEEPGLDQLRRWSDRFEQHDAHRDAVQALFVDVLAPRGYRAFFDRVLIDGSGAVNPFWRETLRRTGESVEPSEETGAP
ncbi:hypothetical protein [Kitasatospora phosalacinea]|uniref:hypothetical protein n=1 Tax=Kitasatospora phosalacinea TaxID=2065 RepID=UPI00131E9505|nr:hypothetical protein [Kitasatospora phosalacinea]